MTTKERVKRMIARQEADRVPITDHPWEGTINRWHREGMPKDADWRDYFDVDKFEAISVDASPRFKKQTIEDTDTYFVLETEYGAKIKYLKGEDSTPEFLDFKISDPIKWAAAKARVGHEKDRINWDRIKNELPLWHSEGRWVEAGFWFGFDVTHSWIVGTETLLVALMEDPDWATDMFHTFLDANMALFDQIWDAGYRFDGMNFCDDMGFKGSQFFSVDVYRELILPAHKKAIAWAANHGIVSRLHSCGLVEPFIPDLMEAGLTILNPLEVKAGMDPIHLKKTYGKKLTLHGGVNAVLWDKPAEIKAEIERVIPVLKENGGYIFSSDHSIPNSVGLSDFKEIVAAVKKVGAY